MTHKPTTLAFAFGGRAAEHDLSIKSALYLLAHVDRRRFRTLSLYVDEKGRLAERDAAAARLSLEFERIRHSMFRPQDRIPADFADWMISTLPAARPGEALRMLSSGEIDVVFPVFHGQGGEDGIFQGFLETLGVPYVGCGIAGSVIGNDKAWNKAVCRTAGIAVADFLVFGKEEWESGREAIIMETGRTLGYPVFVKPPCLGSSVGISKAKDGAGLCAAAAEAFRYGDRMIIEKAILGKEYGIGAIGNGNPRLSAIVEFGEGPDFLDYEAKYGPDAPEDLIPAPLDEAIAQEMRASAARIYRLLGLRGMSRLDFFVENGSVIFNESNTVPGFGRTSVFSKMWEASGLDLPALITELTESALRYGGRDAADSSPADDSPADYRPATSKATGG